MDQSSKFGASSMSQLKRRIDQQASALEMLGVAFCVHCGKPHLQARTETNGQTFIRINPMKRNSGLGMVVCMDDPVSASCFLSMINKSENDESGQIVRVQYHDLALDFAKWVLDSKAFLSAHPYNGFVQTVMAGESIIDADLLAQHLAYWSVVLCDSSACTNVRHLIEMCGLVMTDDEHDALILRCLEVAKTHKHKGQEKYFFRQKKVAPNIFGGLMVAA